MIAESQLMNVPITVQSAARILDDSAPDDTRQSIDPVKSWRRSPGITGGCESLIARGRTKKVSRARQVAMYMLIYELNMTPTQVAASSEAGTIPPSSTARAR